MSRWGKIAFWAVVAGQLLLLAGFIAFKEIDLRAGTDVTLQAVPVDPRSMLQGDYAILDYEIAALPTEMNDLEFGREVFVVLEEQGDSWGAIRYARTRNEVRGELYITGRLERNGRLDLGLGTFFVPEGTGHIVEDATDVKIIANVDSDGSAIIKEVIVDGKPFEEHLSEEG